LAVSRFLVFPGDLDVEDAFRRFREEAREAVVTMYIYITDEKQRLRGVVDIKEMLQADPRSKLKDIMTKKVVAVKPTDMRGDIEALFMKYHFRAMPVVDKAKKIIGVIREKDVFLQEE
jgi:magnesium transporter